MPKKYVKSHSFQIFARTKMPVFDESDEEELNNIINGNQQRLKSNVKPQTQAPPNAVIKQPVILPSIVKPNSDWRSARSDVNRYQSTSYNSKKPPTIKQDDSYFSFTDLDYEDFEQAMREEEAGDMGVTGNKLTPEPIQHSGLMSDDLISKDIWSSLFFSDGSFCDFQKVMRPNSDLLLVLADPRRLNDSFKAMLRQLSQVPVQSLKLSIAAVSCEDVVDLKKYLKKCNYPTNGFSLLSDPTKKVINLSRNFSYCHEYRMFSLLQSCNLEVNTYTLIFSSFI
jgi:hypothetical protein